MNKKLFHIMKEDMRRRSFLAMLSALIFFFSFPVTTMLAGRGTERYFVRFFFSPGKSTLVLMALVFWAVLSGFSYLTKTNRVDFYHSVPAGRGLLFRAIILDNIIMIMGPYFIMLTLAVLIAALQHNDPTILASIPAALLHNLPRVLLSQGVMLLSVMLTGKTFIAVLMSFFINFYLPLVKFLFNGLFSTYFVTWYGGDGWHDLEKLRSVSPFIFCLTDYGEDETGYLISCLIAVVVAALFTFAAWLLYRNRASESAGCAIVFRRCETPLKFAIVIPAGIIGAVIGYSVRDEVSGWVIFWLFCGVAISHSIMEIIYHSDFRKLFSHKGHMLICLGISALIFSLFCFDPLGYDRFIPADGAYDYAGIYAYEIDPNLEQVNRRFSYSYSESPKYTRVSERERFSSSALIDRMKLTDRELIGLIAREGVDSAMEEKGDGHFDSGRVSVMISYHMKPGWRVRRKYTIERSRIESALNKIYDSPAFKEAAYPVFSMNSSELAGASLQDGVGIRRIRCDSDSLGMLLEAYKKDFYTMTSERAQAEQPIFCIRFEDEESCRMEDAAFKQDKPVGYIMESGFYPVYPSFADTIMALSGCLPEYDLTLRFYNYREASISGPNGYFWSTQSPTEINNLLQGIYPELIYSFKRRDEDYSVRISASLGLDVLEGRDYYEEKIAVQFHPVDSEKYMEEITGRNPRF